MVKYRQKTFASQSKTCARKEKEMKQEKLFIAKLLALHATAKIFFVSFMIFFLFAYMFHYKTSSRIFEKMINKIFLHNYNI